MNEIKAYFDQHGLKIILDFYIIFILILYVLRFFAVSSKIKKMMRHITVFLIIGLIAMYADLPIVTSFFESFFKLSPVILVVIFAPELRQILVGYSSTGSAVNRGESEEINFPQFKKQILDAVDYLALHKVGALMTFERKQDLSEYVQKATAVINARVNSELICSIFVPGTPLHDGAIVIANDKIKCAGAYYPSTDRTDLPKQLGSRHRAAIGVSEVNDSLTVVVSEETGKVSVTIQGVLDYGISRDELETYLDKYVDSRKWW